MAKAKIKNTSHINDTDQGIKMATKPANAAQKNWMNDITDWAYENIHMLYTGGYAQDCNFQRHHVLGRSAKHNKVAIGHWFIIPVPFDLHDISSNDPLNVTHHKHAFTKRFGKQTELFSEMMADMDMCGYEVPSQEIYNAIMETRV